MADSEDGTSCKHETNNDLPGRNHVLPAGLSSTSRPFSICSETQALSSASRPKRPSGRRRRITRRMVKGGNLSSFSRLVSFATPPRMWTNLRSHQDVFPAQNLFRLIKSYRLPTCEGNTVRSMPELHDVERLRLRPFQHCDELVWGVDPVADLLSFRSFQKQKRILRVDAEVRSQIAAQCASHRRSRHLERGRS